MIKRTYLLVALVISILAGVFLTCNGNLAEAQNTSSGLTVTMYTERYAHILGESVKVKGQVYNTATFKPASGTVRIQIYKDNTLVYRATNVTREDGSYIDYGFCLDKTGDFEITVIAQSGSLTGNATQMITSQSYRGLNDFIGAYMYQILFICLVIGYFILLIAFRTSASVLGKDQTEIPDKSVRSFVTKVLSSNQVYIASMFIFLTLFTFAVIIFLFFIPSEIGVNSPVGLVVNTFDNETQWIINIGGIRAINSAQYEGGVQFPVYIIVLSFLGAYVYFLYSIPRLLGEKGDQKVTINGISYLARFFIAPVLAGALYLLLWQLEVRGTFILAVVSFAIGLIINDVVKRITTFAQSTLAGETSNDAGTSNQETKQEAV